MNHIEAMKQALEALEYHTVQTRPLTRTQEAMTTLRIAIEAAEKQESVAWVDLLEQAEQIVRGKFLWKRFIDGTPLANDIPVWMADFAQQYAPPTATVQESKKDLMFSTVAMQEREDQRIEQIVGTLEKVKHEQLAALATPPAAQRQWVYLTELEKAELWNRDTPIAFSYADAIEAKLKERNQ